MEQRPKVRLQLYKLVSTQLFQFSSPSAMSVVFACELIFFDTLSGISRVSFACCSGLYTVRALSRFVCILLTVRSVVEHFNLPGSNCMCRFQIGMI